jgi:hypothetical protein
MNEGEKGKFWWVIAASDPSQHRISTGTVGQGSMDVCIANDPRPTNGRPGKPGSCWSP